MHALSLRGEVAVPVSVSTPLHPSLALRPLEMILQSF